MCEVNLDGLRPFDQWELLDFNGHGPSVLCVKWPLHVILEEPIEELNEWKHQNRKMSACNWLDLESLGSWLAQYIIVLEIRQVKVDLQWLDYNFMATTFQKEGRKYSYLDG